MLLGLPDVQALEPSDGQIAVSIGAVRCVERGRPVILHALLPLAFCVPHVPSGDAFASFVVGGGDLNSDGVPDLLVSDQTSQDRLDLWFVSGRDGSVLRHRSPPAPWLSAIERPVERTGDLDRDGIDDFAVWLITEDWREFVELVSGRDASVIRTCTGGSEDDHVLPRGVWTEDVDQDGTADVLLCGLRNAGSIHATLSIVGIDGVDGTIISRIDWEEGWFACGAPVVTRLGDVDGDERDDVAVLVSENSKWTRMVWISGLNGSTIRDFDHTQTEPWMVSLDGGSDLDGDDRPDVAVGLHSSVTIRSGADGVPIMTLRGKEIVDRHRRFGGDDPEDLAGSFGEQVRFVADGNGDGVPDLLVGAPELLGAAYLISGRSGSKLRTAYGQLGDLVGGWDLGQYHVGRALDDAGDLDGDGAGDILVASVPYGFSGFGCVRAFSGRTGDLILYVDRAFLVGQLVGRRGKRMAERVPQER